jgi:hypothetical protein
VLNDWDISEEKTGTNEQKYPQKSTANVIKGKVGEFH